MTVAPRRQPQYGVGGDQCRELQQGSAPDAHADRYPDNNADADTNPDTYTLRDANGAPAAEKLCVWTLLDMGLRVSELSTLTSKQLDWRPNRGESGPWKGVSMARTFCVLGAMGVLAFLWLEPARAALRYHDNDDGTITNLNTGLIGRRRSSSTGRGTPRT